MEKNSIKKVTNIGVCTLLRDTATDLQITLNHMSDDLIKGENVEMIQQEISLVSKHIKSITDGLNLLDLQED